MWQTHDGIPTYEPTGYEILEALRRAGADVPVRWWRRVVRYWLCDVLGF